MARWQAERAVALAFALAAAGWAHAAPPRALDLEIDGMNCALCPITIRKALEGVPGVTQAEASLEAKRARVRYDPDRATPEALIEAVRNAGFTAREKRTP